MIISITRLHLRSLRYLPSFLWHVFTSIRQVTGSPGFLGGKLFVETSLAFWTMTQWANKQAMQSYRNSGAHKVAMPLLFRWCDEAALVTWETQGPGDGLSWDDAHCKMIEKGHFVPVLRPSLMHQKKEIPPLGHSPIEYILKPTKR